MSTNFKIIRALPDRGTMEVEFTDGGKSVVLAIPLPDAGADEVEHVIGHWPAAHFGRASRAPESFADVADSVGQAVAVDLAGRGDPLYGVAGIAVARVVVHQMLATEFERRASQIIDGQWSALERETFERQFAEAVAYQADPQAPTPLLDGLMMDGESKADAAANIVTKANALQAAVAPLIKAKREHLSALYSLATIAEVAAYNFTTGWPV